MMKQVTKETITIELSGPGLPNVTLIDLPGLIKANLTDQVQPPSSLSSFRLFSLSFLLISSLRFLLLLFFVFFRLLSASIFFVFRLLRLLFLADLVSSLHFRPDSERAAVGFCDLMGECISGVATSRPGARKSPALIATVLWL